MTTITCPYCNSTIPPPPGSTAGQRLTCPRCDESFVFQGSGQPLTAATGQTAPPPVRPPRRWSNRSVAALVLGLMASMAGIAVVYALATIDFRREQDPKGLPGETSRDVRVVAPRHLAALGYLPRDTTLIAGLHVAEAMREPAGREFLSRFRPTDFVKLPKQAADDIGGGTLEQWTGLSLDEIDHVVLGGTIENLLLPKIYLVVKTRRPYEPDRIKTQLEAIASPVPGPRQVYTFDVDKPALPGMIWFADKHTLVVGLLTEKLDGVPLEPQPGLAHLQPALREVLEERMGPQAQAWFIGHADDWNKTAVKLLLPTLAKDTRPLVERVRTLGVWITIRDGLTLNGILRTAEPETAEKWDALLVPREGERKPIHLFGSRPALEPVARELAATLKSVRHENWLTIQAKAQVDTVNQALSSK